VAEEAAGAAGALGKIKGPKGMDEYKGLIAALSGTEYGRVKDPFASAGDTLDMAYQSYLLGEKNAGRRPLGMDAWASKAEAQGAMNAANRPGMVDLGGGVGVPMTRQILAVHKAFLDASEQFGQEYGVNRPGNLLELFKAGGKGAELADVLAQGYVEAIANSLPMSGMPELIQKFLEGMGLGKGKGISLTNDWRGSTVQIRVDSRHSDPDRVAMSVFNALDEVASRPTRSPMDLASQ
jgi:hypothetical protein